MRPCPQCGKSIKDLATICKFCEQPVPAAPPTVESDGSPIAARAAQLNDQSKQWYCPTCGTVAWPRTYTKGTFGMEVLLWLLMILPGVLYSLWRITSKYKGCPKCGAPNMIPASSPKARAALSSPGAIST